MKALIRTNARVISASIIIAYAVIASVVISHVHDAPNRQGTRAVAEQHAREAYSQFLSSLQPNTTLHLVVAEHVDHPIATTVFQAHTDSRTETWEAFGADGYLSGMYAFTTDPSGAHIYSTQVFSPPSTLVITDVVSGKTTTLSQHESAAALAARLGNAFDRAISEMAAQGATPVTARDSAGVKTYILESKTGRDYVDTSTYQGVQSDELALDGSVTRSVIYTVNEVLPGNAVPTMAVLTLR
jgi:hypothetical protein